MEANLESITKHSIRTISEIDVHEIMHVGSDSDIARAAWVSTGKEGHRPKFQSVAESGVSVADQIDQTKEYDARVQGLINYLVKNRHGSPFEHGSLTVYVHAPLFVWREWHRHRIGFSYNEESARYKTLDPVFYLPQYDRPMMKVNGWKPGRPKFKTVEDHFTDQHDAADVYEQLCDNLTESYILGYKMYMKNLELGVDPGLARDCLPVGIYSSCWVTCNPRSIMSFLSLRVQSEDSTFRSYPLYEIDVAAQKLEEIFSRYWPATYQAFVDNGRVAP